MQRTADNTWPQSQPLTLSKIRVSDLVSALLVIGLFLGVYVPTARGRVQVSDEVAVLASAVNLATTGTLAVNNLAWLEPLVPNTIHVGRGGDLYTKYFPGNMLLAAGLYRLAAVSPDQEYWWNAWPAPSRRGVRVALLVNPFLGALTLGVLWLVLAHLYDRRVAWLTVLAMGLGSDWWYQSRGFFSEVGAGALLLLAVWGGETRRPWLSSLSLGVSLLFRPTNVLGFPVWLWSVQRAGGNKRAWLSGLGWALGIGGLAWYNYARFGALLNFGYGSEPFALSGLLTGLYGVLLSPGRSIFVYSPVLLLAFPGLVSLWRQRRGLALSLAFTIAGYVGMVALWHSWEGGWSWGSRLLTPIIPLAGVAAGAGIAWLETRAWRWRRLVWVALLLCGLGINVLAMGRDPVDTLTRTVGVGSVAFTETLYSPRHAFPVLQARYLLQNGLEWDGLAIRQE